jgi:DHA2 family multidrug resistance protein-like MFS transporter
MKIETVTGRGSRRWWALGAMTLGVLAVGLDVTVLSVAMPTLARSLHASTSDLQWFSSGYALVLAAAMLPAGWAGDRFGRKGLMLVGLFVFGAASAACAYASSAGAFIAARAALGLAGAAVIVMALSVLTVLFSETERPRAVGVWAAANFLALPVGPILGGWLLTHYWWGWVFLMNVPVAVLGFVAVLALVPESRAPERPGLDVGGVVASSGGLALVTYGLIRAGEGGWTSAGATAALVAGVAVLGAFALWERRLGSVPGGKPLVDLGLFSAPAFTWGVILAATGILAMIGVLFTMPLYFQGVRGVNAMGSGLRLLPLIGGLVVGAVPADRLAERIGARLTVGLGFAVLAVGSFLGATTSVGSSEGFIAAWMALTGAGMGLAMATAASAAMSKLPSERSGVGSALMQALQKVGAPFGAAILGSVLSSGYRSRLALDGLPAAAASAVRGSLFAGIAVAQKVGSAALLSSVRTSFVHGMDLGLVVSAGVAAAGMVLALVFLPRRAAPARGRVEPVSKEGLRVS